MSDRSNSANASTGGRIRTDGGWDDDSDDAESTPDIGTDNADNDPDGWTFEMVDGEGDDTDAEPLGDLARRLGDRKDAAASENGSDEAFDELNEAWTGEGAAPSDADELFEEMDVSNVDTEALWDSVLGDADPDPVDFEPDGDFDMSGGDSGEWGSAFESDDESEEVVVPKNSHCESCYFFTSPPEAACTYEGSEVVEVVDSEQFLVRDCPVVADVVDTDGSPVGEGDGLAAETSD